MTINGLQVHSSWLMRAALVLLVTALADGLTAWLAPRPMLWCALIASTLPLSMIVFVVFPMLRQDRRESESGTVKPR
jgi:hypothetical protein